MRKGCQTGCGLPVTCGRRQTVRRWRNVPTVISSNGEQPLGHNLTDMDTLLSTILFNPLKRDRELRIENYHASRIQRCQPVVCGLCGGGVDRGVLRTSYFNQI